MHPESSTPQRRYTPRPRKGEYRTCPTCGKTFYLYPSKVRETWRRGEFCSHRCSARHISGLRKGTLVPAAWRPWSFVCEQCGETVGAPASGRYSKRNNRFCDQECAYAYQRAHPETQRFFRGGRNPYYGPDWPQQRRLARERDRHTCQDCGVVQRRPLLDVHHLIPRRAFDHLDYVAANALGNLVTLCRGCHATREAALTLTAYRARQKARASASRTSSVSAVVDVGAPCSPGS